MDESIWTDATETVGEWGSLSLVIDTDTYAGGFEREILVAATGVWPEYPNGITRQVAAAFGSEPVYKDLVGWLIYDGGDDDVHRDRVDICPTPGWSNEGGEHYRATPDRPYAHPAYQSGRIALNRLPTADEIADIKRRALDFAADPRTKFIGPFKILGFRIVRSRTMTQAVVV